MVRQGLDRTHIRLSDVGMVLAIITFVIAQFVDVAFFDVGSVPITAQKILATSLFPLSLLLMGRVRINRLLALLALSISFAYSASYLVAFAVRAELLSANIVVLIGFAGAMVLYTALTESPGAISVFARIWIGFSVVTALVTFLQTIGLVPLFTVRQEYLAAREVLGGLYRGVGLKFDPNFQALVLAIGIVSSLHYARRFRAVIIGIILLGVIGTFSRMGLILAIVVLLVTPIVKALERRRGILRAFLRTFVTAVAVTSFALALFSSLPPTVKDYVKERSRDAFFSFQQVIRADSTLASGRNRTSGEVRVVLARTALALASENWGWGVGAYQTERLMFESTGIYSVAHNTYLELFMIGGIWGILCVLLYAYIIIVSIFPRGRSRDVSSERDYLIMLSMLFALAGLFLSLTYNSLIWLPVVVALAVRRRRHTIGGLGG